MPITRPVKTPQADSLVPPALKAIERALEALERAPKRRRQPLNAELDRLKALVRLTRSFEWLMDRYEAIQNPPPVPYRSYDDTRAELKRRLDAQLVQEEAGTAGEGLVAAAGSF